MMTTTINNSNIDDDISNNDNNNIRSRSNNVTSSLLLRIAVGSTNPCKINAVREAVQIVIGRHRHNNNNNNQNKTTTQKKKSKKKDDGSDDDDDTPNTEGLDNDDDNDNIIVDDDDHVELDIKGYSSPSGVPDQPFGDAETQLGAQNRAKHAYEAYTEENNGIQPHFAIGLEGGLEWSSSSSSSQQSNNNNDDDETTSSNKQTLWCMAWMAIYGEKRQRQKRKQSSSSSLSNNFDIVTNLIASKDCIYNNNKTNNNNSNDDVDFKKSQIHYLEYGLSKTGMFMLPTSISNLVMSGIELGDADDQIFGRINSKHGSGTVGLLTDGLIDRSVYYENALILALIPWIRPDVY